jgi:glyoxylase-like metal-dependent hydrolase (beta-lactamase superfamily II)
VRSTVDGGVIELAGRAITVADTPGHARHHHCLWDEASRGWFTGDTFGLSYREFDTAAGAWIVPTSTPVQFDPDALRTSIERLLARDPSSIFLTHYSRVGDVPRLGRLLLSLLDEMVAVAQRLKTAADRHQALKRELLALYGSSLAAHGWRAGATPLAELLAVDLELNAQGIAVWLDK